MIEDFPIQSIEAYEVAIFHNKKSTNAPATLKHVQKTLARLESIIPINYFETSADSTEMLDIYAEAVNPNKYTLTGVVGGDGTIKILNDARTALADSYPNTALWAVAGGAAANLLKSSIAKEFLSRPDKVLELGRIASFNTLSIEVTTREGEITKDEAVTAIGINGTRAMIFHVNQENHRKSPLRRMHIGHYAIGKWPADAIATLVGLGRAPRYYSQESEDGKEETDFETFFMNTPIVATIVRAPEISLTSPAQRIDFRRKRNIPSTLIKMRLGHSPGADLIEPVVIRPTEKVYYQVDGETQANGREYVLERGSTIKVSQTKEPTALVVLERPKTRK